MTDFHAHVLPGMDDGSASVATSLKMLEMWQEQGRVDTVCATPHFYADREAPRSFLRRRRESFERLAEARPDGGPRLLLGAEVHYFDGVSRAEELPLLCLEGTKLLLLEMPFVPWTDRMLGQVGEILQRGVRPVAAHLERYLSFNSSRTIRRLMETDVLIQCNAEFFLDRHTGKRALKMLRDGEIDFLGTDAHNTGSRAPNLAAAAELIEKKLGRGALDDLEALEGRWLPS